MTDEWDLQVHGFRIEDRDRVGIEGSIPLPGVTVLFGRNGAGKSRVIEYLDSLLSPSGELGGRQEADCPDDYYGWLYFDPHDGERQDDAARWLRKQVVHGGYDFGAEGGTSADELAAALDRSGWSGLADALAGGVPTGSTGTVALLREVVSSGLLAYQRLDYGAVDLALAPPAVEHLRDAAGIVLAGTVGEDPPPEDTLAHRIATTISQATGGYVHVAELVGLPPRSGGELWAAGPRVVWLRDDPQDLEQIIDEIVYGRWRADEERGLLVLDGLALDLLRSIEARATKLLPRFVRDRGSVSLSPLQTDEGVRPRTGVRFALTAEGETVDYRQLGAGMRRWVGASLLMARAELWPNRPLTWEPDELQDVDSGLVLLVDEPELHLHPAAQRDVAEWLVERNRDGALVLAASHSPSFLNLPSDLASLVAVLRNEAVTTLYDMSPDILDAVDDLAEVLGFDRHAWLYAVRGVLIVEGEHDVRVLRHFFRRELSEARVLPLPLRGSKNIMAMIESEFLGRAHVPMRVMFNHTSAEAFRTDEMPEGARTPEERKLVQFLHQRRAGMDVEPIPYPEPDIICALPPDAVRRAYPEAQFEGWRPLIDDWTNRDPTGRPGFKPYVLDHMRIKDAPDEFVERVLLHVRPGDNPSGGLRRAIDTALASIPLS